MGRGVGGESQEQPQSFGELGEGRGEIQLSGGAAVSRQALAHTPRGRGRIQDQCLQGLGRSRCDT